MAYFLLFVLHGSWKVCMFVVALFVRNKCHSCNFFRSFVRLPTKRHFAVGNGTLKLTQQHQRTARIRSLSQ